MLLKTCRGCGQQKPIGDFYRSRNLKDHPDGYDCRCKECRRKEKRDEYARNRKVPYSLRYNDRGQVVERKDGKVRLYWPEMTQRDFIRRFPFEINEDLAIDFGCSVRTITRRARELGLEKDPDWLQAIWDERRRMAHRINKLPSTRKADLTHFIEGGKAHQFKPGHVDTRTPEQRAETMRKAWVTRRRKAILNGGQSPALT